MKILDWFKQIVAAGESTAPGQVAHPAAPAAPPPIQPAAGDTGEYAGLNFQSAIDAHVKWKVRLENYINGTSDENLKIDVVSRDDQCPLGKWIHSTGGEKFGSLREFQQMKMEHARFHLAAGDIVACCQAGDKAGALDRLHQGEYPKASERVKLYLARLYVQLVK